MESNNNKPPTGGEQFHGSRDAAFHLTQFVIHGNAQRLEAARCAINAGRIARHGAAHQGGQISSGREGRFRAARDNVACNAARETFLTKAKNNVGQFAFRQAIHQLRRAGARFFHAHIKRAVSAEGKAALRLIDLEGRNTKIHYHAIKRGNAAITQYRQHIAEAAFNQMQPTSKTLRQRRTARNRIRVAVYGENRATRCRFQNSAGIAATAKSGIQISRAILWAKRCQHFSQHYWHMALHGHGARPAAAGKVRPRSRARSRASSVRRRAASGSQIWKIRPTPTQATASVSAA